MRMKLPALFVSVCALLLVSCGSSPESPAAPTRPLSGSQGTAVRSLAVSPTPAPTPFPAWQQGGAVGDFRFQPDPAQGPVPLEVHVNMCHATDPDPEVGELHYHVAWGDGATDHGPCRFAHTYAQGGTFEATACVWDRIPAHYPGACSSFQVTANAEPAPTPTPPLYCQNLPGFCPAKTQFCETVPINNASSAHAQDACNACYGGGCFSARIYAGGSPDAYAWVNGTTIFFYSNGSRVLSCGTSYIWVPKPADVGSGAINGGSVCGAGFW